MRAFEAVEMSFPEEFWMILIAKVTTLARRQEEISIMHYNYYGTRKVLISGLPNLGPHSSRTQRKKARTIRARPLIAQPMTSPLIPALVC